MKKNFFTLFLSLLITPQISANSESVNLTAIIPNGCFIVIDEEALQKDLIVAPGNTLTTDVNLICNSQGGAKVTLKTLTGGLYDASSPPNLLSYVAWLDLSGADVPNLTLFANGEPDSVSQDIRNPLVLTWRVNYPLTVSIPQAAIEQSNHSGVYGDGLVLELTAL